MTEWEQGIIFTLKGLSILIFAFCYWMGGRTGVGKWVRRFVGSAFIGAVAIGFSFWQGCWSYWYLLYPILFCICLHLGYGGSSLWGKIRRRFIYGLAIGLSVAPLAVVNGAYLLWGYHLGLCIVSSVLLGVLNPLGSAVDEEGLLAMFYVLLPLFMLRYV